MRDQNDVPHIVIQRDSSGGLGSFILGAAVGAGLALLFAPKSGEETQEELKVRARRLRKVAEERVKLAQEGIEARLEQTREGVHAGMDSMRDAVDAGRKAAVDARGELERKLGRSKAAYRAGIDAARETIEAGAEDE